MELSCMIVLRYFIEICINDFKLKLLILLSILKKIIILIINILNFSSGM